MTVARRMLLRARSSTLARDSGHMLAGQLLRAGTQAIYFVLLARALAPDGYGAFVGAAALVGVAAPFASLGGGNLLVKEVAREPGRFATALGNAWMLVATTGLALLGVTLAAARLVLSASTPLALVVLVGAAELLFARFLDVCGAAFQARGRLSLTAFLQLVLSAARLGAIAVLGAAAHEATPLAWGWCYLAATVLAAVGGCALVVRQLGGPSLDVRRLFANLREGAWFAVSLSAQSIYNDIDKTMLVRLGSLEAAGIYGAAYRLLDVSFLPIRSLLFASYAGFFRHGARGLSATVAYAKRLLPISTGYAAAAVLAMIVAAPLVRLVLGVGYAEVSDALRWLAPILLLRSVHYFAADALTGAGRQALRSAGQLLVAAANVALNLWLIPAHGWRGAAWASLGADALLAALLVLAVLALGGGPRRER